MRRSYPPMVKRYRVRFNFINVRNPKKAVAKSISARRISDDCRTFENLSISFVNTVGDQPYAFFIYVPTQILGSGSNCTRQSWGSNPVTRSVMSTDSTVVEDACGCDCERCDGDSDCSCKEMNVPELSRECGPSCRCELVCENRLTQRGISVMLKIVKEKKKSWGLHSDKFIQKGDFLCECAGELLTTKETRMRQHMMNLHWVPDFLLLW